MSDTETTRFSTTPWEYTYDPQAGWAEATVWDRGGDLVCAVSTQMAGDGTLETATDRARLIAAAPDLLRRLQDAHDALDALPEEALGRDPDVGYPYLMELKDNIEDALDKATPDDD